MSTVPEPGTIREAAERIAPYIHRTPLLHCSGIDRLRGCSILFKCENLQKAGAFKSRGAVNAVFSLNAEKENRGVCTHSSGNHAAALSRAAALRKMPAYIVMPENSNPVKIAAVKEYGGQITFCKPSLKDRETSLETVKEKTGASEIHPYNDVRIIAGQATAALEIFQDTAQPDILMAPVGGGGLLSGTALSAHYFSSGTQVIAAEPKAADDAARSFHSRTFVPSDNPQTIADGLLTSLGSLTYPLILKHVHDILTVEEDTIVTAMKTIWERMKLVVEPSSAVPLAAVLENPGHFKGRHVIIILSGGNADLMKLPWMTR